MKAPIVTPNTILQYFDKNIPMLTPIIASKMTVNDERFAGAGTVELFANINAPAAPMNAPPIK